MDETKSAFSFGEVLNGMTLLFVLGITLAIYVKVKRIECKLKCHQPPPPPEEEAVKIDLTLDEKE